VGGREAGEGGREAIERASGGAAGAGGGDDTLLFRIGGGSVFGRGSLAAAGGGAAAQDGVPQEEAPAGGVAGGVAGRAAGGRDGECARGEGANASGVSWSDGSSIGSLVSGARSGDVLANARAPPRRDSSGTASNGGGVGSPAIALICSRENGVGGRICRGADCDGMKPPVPPRSGAAS
jgi:hypothetical protein